MSGAIDRCRERIREYLDTPIEGATPKLTKEEYETIARMRSAPSAPAAPAPPLRTYYDPANPSLLSAPAPKVAPAPYYGPDVNPQTGAYASSAPAAAPAPYYGPDVNPKTGAYASSAPAAAQVAAQTAQTAPQVQAAAAQVVAAAPAELRTEAQAAQRQAAFASTPAEVQAAKLAVERIADQANAGSKVVLYSAIGVGALGILGFMIYLARRK
jgi:hypothetical protein